MTTLPTRLPAKCGVCLITLLTLTAPALLHANVVIEPGQVIVHDSRPAPGKLGDGYAHAVELLFPGRSLHAYHCDRSEYIIDGYESTARLIGYCQLVLGYDNKNNGANDRAADDLASTASYTSAVKLTEQNISALMFNQCRFDTSRRYKVLDAGVLRWRSLHSFSCMENER